MGSPDVHKVSLGISSGSSRRKGSKTDFMALGYDLDGDDDADYPGGPCVI